MYQSDLQQHSSYSTNMNNNAYPQQLKALSDTNTENIALHYFCSNSVSSDINNNNNCTFLDNTISSLSTTMLQTTSSQSYTPKYHRISSITSIGSTISSSTPSSKRKSKKNRKSRKNNKLSNTMQSYDPISSHRAQGRIQISKAMTEKIIPVLIKEEITDLYMYVDKSIGLSEQNNFINDHKLIINFDFHDKKTNEILYCVAQKQDDTQKSSRGYQWKIMDKLFTANAIFNQFKINNISLPRSVRNSDKFKRDLSDGEKIKKCLQNSGQWQKLLKKSKWCKTDVLTKANNKRRVTLSVTKSEFMKSCNEFMNNTKYVKLLPIIMFSNNECKYWIEFLWIVRLEQEQIDIGIAFKYDNDHNNVIVKGIHLNKEYMLRQHQLVLPQHKCDCLNNFQSDINDFRIGNPDDDKNRIKYYKQQIEELQRKLETFEDNNNNNVNKNRDKSEILNIETTCLIKQESDNCYYNNNGLIQSSQGLNIAEIDESVYYNIPETPTFDEYN